MLGTWIAPAGWLRRCPAGPVGCLHCCALLPSLLHLRSALAPKLQPACLTVVLSARGIGAQRPPMLLPPQHRGLLTTVWAADNSVLLTTVCC